MFSTSPLGPWRHRNSSSRRHLLIKRMQVFQIDNLGVSRSRRGLDWSTVDRPESISGTTSEDTPAIDTGIGKQRRLQL